MSDCSTGAGRGLLGMKQRYTAANWMPPASGGWIRGQSAPPDGAGVTARELELLRVVIVDDQSRVRAGFRMILESEDGIEVVAEASDGEEAVRAVRQTRPDLVLMDIRMPGPDGLEATGGSDGLRDRPGAAGT